MNSLDVVSDTSSASEEDINADRLLYTNCDNNIPRVIGDDITLSEIQGRIASSFVCTNY